jgi:DNA polymerase III sliding clamp (beta) subunit (PCNA family)
MIEIVIEQRELKALIDNASVAREKSIKAGTMFSNIVCTIDPIAETIELMGLSTISQSIAVGDIQVIRSEDELYQVCLPRDRFSDIINNLPAKQVKLMFDKELKIACERCKFAIPLDTEIVSQLPVRFAPSDATGYEFTKSELVEAFSMMIPIIPEEGQHSLGYMGFFEEGIILVGTDSRRMYMTKINSSLAMESQFIPLAKSSLIAMKGILSKTQESVNLYFDEGIFSLAAGRTVFSTRTLDPEGLVKVEQLRGLFELPQTSFIRFNRVELLSALKRCNIISSSVGINLVEFLLEGDVASLSTAKHLEQGNASDQVSVCLDGELSLFSISTQYLIDSLSSFKTEEVLISATDKIRPMVLQEWAGGANEYPKHLIAPIERANQISANNAN